MASIALPAVDPSPKQREVLSDASKALSRRSMKAKHQAKVHPAGRLRRPSRERTPGTGATRMHRRSSTTLLTDYGAWEIQQAETKRSSNAPTWKKLGCAVHKGWLPRFPLHPYSPWVRTWTRFMLAVYTYTAVAAPLNMAFPEVSPSISALNGIVYACYLLDMVASFATGYFVENSSKVEQRWRDIAQRYVRSWFVLDFLTALPWWALVQTGRDSLSQRIVHAVPRLLRLVRLSKPSYRFLLDGALSRVALTLTAWLLYAHLLACSLVLFGQHPPDGATLTWLQAYELDGDTPQPVVYAQQLVKHAVCPV